MKNELWCSMGEKFRKLSCVRKVVGLVVSVGLAGYAIWYLWASKRNPKVIEVVVGSILITVVLGSCTDFYAKLREPGRRKYPTGGLIRSLSLLVVLTAFIVYASNSPNPVRAEIPVTYVFQVKTLSIPIGLVVPRSSLFMPQSLFRVFRDENAANRGMVENMVDLNGQKNVSADLRVFHDMTEYLLLWSIAHPSLTAESNGDLETALARGESRNWLAFPNKAIEGTRRNKDCIEGSFKDNLFYDVNEPVLLSDPWDLRLPRDTRVVVTRNGALHSKITIRNPFETIEFGVHALVIESGWPVPVRGLRFYPGTDPNGPFKEYRCLITCTASFRKWPYGFPQMRHHEQWVTDLLALVQRSFAWGSLKIPDPIDVMEQYQPDMIRGR